MSSNQNSQPQTRPDPSELLQQIADLAADKKASEIVALDLRSIVGYTDFFLICSGNSDRQTKAIFDGIYQGLKHKTGIIADRVEGLPQAHWILLDYGDVIVHIFTPETRDYYRLEQLWGEAPGVELK